MARAVAISWSFGSDHPNTQTVRGNYIALLQDMGLPDPEIQAKLQALQLPNLQLSAPGNTPLSVPTPMAFPPVPPTTSSPSVELLMDVANTTQEITSRLTARAFSGIAKPEQG